MNEKTLKEKNLKEKNLKIVILDGSVVNPGDVSYDALVRLGELVVYPDTAPQDIAERVAGADVVLVNKVRLGEADLPNMRSVGLIGLLATGYDNVDVRACAGAGIPVCNVVAYGVATVAQHTLALLLELCNGVGMHDASVKKGEWTTDWCYWKKAPRTLTGETMGIIGFGRIGQRVALLAHALGMHIVTVQRPSTHPAKDTNDIHSRIPYQALPLDELLHSAHVISLHCPLTDETRGIIGSEALAKMRNDALIVNTARGALIDEAACAQALRDGRLAGLACDVLSLEPPIKENPLLSAPNTVITPHMAWASTQARQNILELMAKNIAAWRAGSPINIVNNYSKC